MTLGGVLLYQVHPEFIEGLALNALSFRLSDDFRYHLRPFNHCPTPAANNLNNATQAHYLK